MLSKSHRVLTGDDFKATVRRGKRFPSPHAIVYVVETRDPGPTTFGFIVSKAVGNAVERNLVRRRLRSIAAETLAIRDSGSTVVVRVLPDSANLPWDALRSEISASLLRSAEDR